MTASRPISAPAKASFADALSGLVETGVPIVRSWSLADPARLIDQGTRLSAKLCAAGHCPRSAVLTGRAGPGSMFDLDGTSDSLRERLVGQIRVRGLP
jgi:hypothetical protein